MTTKVTKNLLNIPKSLTSNGYAQIGDGLILQWGLTTDDAISGTVTFPQAFPNGCLNVVATCTANPVGNAVRKTLGVGNFSTSGFDYASRLDDGTNPVSGQRDFYWQAIGW